MALIPTCDKCARQNVQLITVLGVDICNACVALTKEFLVTAPPQPEPKLDDNSGKHVSRKVLRAALTALGTRESIGRLEIEDIAIGLGISYRKARLSLCHLAKIGDLSRPARNRFGARQ